MHPRISLNTISSLAWPLADDLAMLERLGATRFGFPLLKIEDDVDGGVEAIRRSGLGVTCVAASTADASLLDPDGALAALAPAIDAAGALGSPLCYFTSGRTPGRMTTDDACAALVEALPPAIAHAKQAGVRLAVENSSVTNRSIGFVHTLPDAGYEGLFDLEVIGRSVDAEGPESALRRSADWLGERLQEYGA